MRDLKPDERRAILLLAARFGSDEERNQLFADLERCTVEEKVPDGSILGFDIAGMSDRLSVDDGNIAKKTASLLTGP